MKKVEISIIIATRHREEILWEAARKAITAIKNKNAEIIIVNDGDKSLDIPEELFEKIIYFNNPKRGVSAARNFGALQAKGEILFFIDDDMWINSEVIDWINSYIINKENTEAVYLINWEYPAYLKDILIKKKVGRHLLSSNYHTLWGRMQKKSVPPVSGLYKYNFIGSGSLVMHKNIFSNAGCYNEKMIFQGEDDALATKFNALAIPIYVVFDVTLQHNHKDRLEINNFLKRIYEGFGSEFKAAHAGVVTSLSNTNYRGVQKMLFEFSRITEKAWIFILNILPNHPDITPLNNKLIGALGALQRYKQWRKIISKKK